MTRSREPKRHPGKKCKSMISDWRVIDRHCSYTRGQFKPSESSKCKCTKCKQTWRTKGDYVVLLKDATAKERFK